MLHIVVVIIIVDVFVSDLNDQVLHARRHPQKRLYVREEENPYSFIDQKHNNFQQFLNLSRCNIGILRDGKGKFYEYKDLEAQLWGNPTRSTK